MRTNLHSRNYFFEKVLEGLHICEVAFVKMREGLLNLGRCKYVSYEAMSGGVRWDFGNWRASKVPLRATSRNSCAAPIPPQSSPWADLSPKV